jgi:hypothetical protein
MNSFGTYRGEKTNFKVRSACTCSLRKLPDTATLAGRRGEVQFKKSMTTIEWS